MAGAVLVVAEAPHLIELTGLLSFARSGAMAPKELAMPPLSSISQSPVALQRHPPSSRAPGPGRFMILA
eukprot:1758619-Pyramimonas_sp.AAC.1